MRKPDWHRPYALETDWLAGHVRFELRNVVANYPFESSRGFPRSEPNSGHGDHSRLSLRAGDTHVGIFSKRSARALAIMRRRREGHELAAISFDQKMIRRRQSQQYHCSGGWRGSTLPKLLHTARFRLTTNVAVYREF